jgi:NAD(P)-dependent dehydrogenase (short-subunit alcohol dehydrogenase family)
MAQGQQRAGRLEGRVAVITGGASGIGRATALRFLDEGASVVVADMNEGTGKETLELAAARGAEPRARFLRTDVSREADVEAMIALALSEFGRLDVVFNNAGLVGAIGEAVETEVEDWDATFAVLVRGVFLGVKHGARAMIAAGRGGSILNTASVAGLSGGAGPMAYSSAKAAVVNLTRVAANELAEHRIRVNALCPGGIHTPLLHRGNEAPMRERLAALQPWPEAGEAHHIAGAALFLASDDAAFVTGEALVVDGGLTAAGPDMRRRWQDDAEAMPFQFVGFDRGTTGEPPVVRKLEPRKPAA